MSYVRPLQRLSRRHQPFAALAQSRDRPCRRSGAKAMGKRADHLRPDGRRRSALFIGASAPGSSRSSRRSPAGSSIIGVLWPLRLQPPWWILTDYPAVNDQMTFLDGAMVLAYIGATALAIGTAGLLLPVACRPQPWTIAKAKISSSRAKSYSDRGLWRVSSGSARSPSPCCGPRVLRSAFVGSLRALLLGGAALWTIVLGWRIAGLSTAPLLAPLRGNPLVACAALIGVASWVMLFWVWQ